MGRARRRRSAAGGRIPNRGKQLWIGSPEAVGGAGNGVEWLRQGVGVDAGLQWWAGWSLSRAGYVAQVFGGPVQVLDWVSTVLPRPFGGHASV